MALTVSQSRAAVIGRLQRSVLGVLDLAGAGAGVAAAPAAPGPGPAEVSRAFEQFAQESKIHRQTFCRPCVTCAQKMDMTCMCGDPKGDHDMVMHGASVSDWRLASLASMVHTLMTGCRTSLTDECVRLCMEGLASLGVVVGGGISAYEAAWKHFQLHLGAARHCQLTVDNVHDSAARRSFVASLASTPSRGSALAAANKSFAEELVDKLVAHMAWSASAGKGRARDRRGAAVVGVPVLSAGALQAKRKQFADAVGRAFAVPGDDGLFSGQVLVSQAFEQKSKTANRSRLSVKDLFVLEYGVFVKDPKTGAWTCRGVMSTLKRWTEETRARLGAGASGVRLGVESMYLQKLAAVEFSGSELPVFESPAF